MKTTLDGVVFFVAARVRSVSYRPREEGGNGMRRPGESCRTRTVGRQDEAAERGSKMDSRTERQDGAQNKAAEQGGRTGRQDGAAGRGGRKRGGGRPRHRSGQVRGRRPHKQKNGIPTAGSRRTAKKRTEKRPGICKRPTHRFSIRCSDTGKGAILSARPPLVK